MQGDKTTIKDEDILYIGIPGVKHNLTLNIENPLKPGETPWGEGDESIPRVKPANILTDYKLIIIDPDDLGDIYFPSHTFAERRTQLRSFLEHGGLLVCIIRKVGKVKCFKTQENVLTYDFIVNSWDHYTEPIGVSSSKLRIVDQGKKSPFFEILKSVQEVAVYLKDIKDLWGINGDPNFLMVGISNLAEISNDKTVAFEAKPLMKTEEDAVELLNKGIPSTPSKRYLGRGVYQETQGKMIFLPEYVLRNVDLLVECAKRELIQMGTAGFVPATWFNDYSFPDCEAHEKRIQDLNIQIRKETEELEIQEKSFEELKEVRDVLLNGQSKLLEQVVKKVFNEFGIAFVEGPTGRDDLILRDESNQTILVSEVKGLKNSASEGDARQLNQWCDRVFEEEKHEPKGLLLVNAWREKEPTDRNEAIFTDQMLPYCNKREFCLMTTIQLFNMWCAFKRGEFKGGDELLNQIIETVGVFPGFDDPSENRIK